MMIDIYFVSAIQNIQPQSLFWRLSNYGNKKPARQAVQNNEQHDFARIGNNTWKICIQ